MRTVAGTRNDLPPKRWDRSNPDKWCPNCATWKPRSAEHWNRTGRGLQSYCRACSSLISDKYKGKHVMRVRALKDGQPCMDCHVPFPFYCLDYDHRPGVEKKGEIARMASGTYKWETILAEIAKCDLICANCHRKRTWQRSTEAGHTS